MTDLSKNIMRRVYYAFALRIGTHPVVIHGSVFALCLFALSRVVSIPNVLANLMEVKVGEVTMFFVGALLNTQLVTLVLLALIALDLVWLVWRLWRGRAWPGRQAMA